MAILDAGDELDALTALPLVDGLGQCFVQVIDEHACIISLQITTVVGDNLAVFEGYNITANGEVVVCHVVADAGSLQWAATLVHLVQVIAEDGGVGDFRARREPFWNCDEASAATFPCQPVHVFGTGILQQRLVAKTGHLVVSHAIP